jgi:hypothetical protein
MMADDKEKNREPVVACLFDTDIPSSTHSEKLLAISSSIKFMLQE